MGRPMKLTKFLRPLAGLLAVATVAGASLIAASPAQAATPGYTVIGTRISSGACLTIGQAITSYDDASYPTPKTVLVMQGDGNLVDYPRDASNGIVGAAYWSTRTTGAGNRACFQTDGNFVVYSPANVALWTSHTSGVVADWVETSPSASDPSVVLFRAGSPDLLGDGATWSSVSGPRGDLSSTPLGIGQSTSSPDGHHSLTFQTDGNVVLRNASGAATWSTGTAGKASRFFAFVATSSLTAGQIGVFSGPKSLLWTASWTQGSAAVGHASKLVLQNDGNLVVYSSTGVALWNSHTAGK